MPYDVKHPGSLFLEKHLNLDKETICSLVGVSSGQPQIGGVA